MQQPTCSSCAHADERMIGSTRAGFAPQLICRLTNAHTVYERRDVRPGRCGPDATNFTAKEEQAA